MTHRCKLGDDIKKGKRLERERKRANQVRHIIQIKRVIKGYFMRGAHDARDMFVDFNQCHIANSLKGDVNAIVICQTVKSNWYSAHSMPCNVQMNSNFFYF